MSVSAHHMTRKSQRNRVTISDLSDALRLTKSTVSRALNEYPDISEGARLRVRKMANKMGYQPLSFAQAIRTGLVKPVGLVIQTGDRDAQRPFLAEFLAGVSQGSSAQGWTLTLAASMGETETLDTFRSLIHDHKVDGFILPRTMVKDARVALLRDANVPFVMFGRTGDPIDCAWFDVLGEDAMRDATHHLVSLGHRRIGFINGGQQYNYAALRRDGFLDAMAQAGLEVDPTLMSADAVTIPEGRAAARVMLEGPTPPTAIVCAVDMAVTIAKAIAQHLN